MGHESRTTDNDQVSSILSFSVANHGLGPGDDMALYGAGAVCESAKERLLADMAQIQDLGYPYLSRTQDGSGDGQTAAGCAAREGRLMILH